MDYKLVGAEYLEGDLVAVIEPDDVGAEGGASAVDDRAGAGLNADPSNHDAGDVDQCDVADGEVGGADIGSDDDDRLVGGGGDGRAGRTGCEGVVHDRRVGRSEGNSGLPDDFREGREDEDRDGKYAEPMQDFHWSSHPSAMVGYFSLPSRCLSKERR